MEPWLRGLYDAEGMRAVDRWAIEGQGVDSLTLMEAAGRAVAEAVAGLRPEGPVRVVCGKGNNGGDGLVAARLLGEMGFEAEVLLLWPADELSEDAAANLRRLPAPRARRRQRSPPIPAALAATGRGEAIDGASAGGLRGRVVDAIFGTGFSGAPREPAAAAIEAIGACGAPGRRLRQRLRGRCGERRGRRRSGRGRRHRHLPRRQGRPLRRPRQVGDR